MSEIQQKFQNSLLHFNNKQYEEGINLINECIEIQSGNADLLINRALFNINLDRRTEAIADLNKAVQIDPHNYVAYFNLASLNIKQGDHIETLQNTCCSLSCLYLSKARITQNKEDVKKALFYAENNVEAHVLRGFMYLEQGSEKKALRQLDRAWQLDPQNSIIQKIRKAVYHQLMPYHNLYSQDTQSPPSKRLRSNYVPSQGQQIDTEIEQKVKQFNDLLKQMEGKLQNEGKIFKVLQEGQGQGQTYFQIRQSHL